MNYQVQIDTQNNVVIDYRSAAVVATNKPWGSGDTRFPFTVVPVDIDYGETKTINYDSGNLEFTLPEIG